MNRSLLLFGIVFAIFGCDTKERACDSSGCTSYHGTTYADQGTKVVTGSIEVTKPNARRIDESAGLTLQIHANGTIEMMETVKIDHTPPSWCPPICPLDLGSSDDAGARSDASDAGDAADASEDAGELEPFDGGTPDGGDLPLDAGAPKPARDAGAPCVAVNMVDPVCRSGPRTEARTRGHLALDLPSDDGEYDLREVNAELWYCASPAATILPVAASDGIIGPGCFEEGKDFVPALREPLEGRLTVFKPPVSLDDLREEESGFAFHYAIGTRGGAATNITLDVTAWNKQTVVTCGELF